MVSLWIEIALIHLNNLLSMRAPISSQSVLREIHVKDSTGLEWRFFVDHLSKRISSTMKPLTFNRSDSRADNTRLVGQNHYLYSVSQAQLCQHVTDMCLDSGLADKKLAGYFGITQPASN